MYRFYVYILRKRLHSKFDGRFDSPLYKVIFEISSNSTPPKGFKYLDTIMADSYDDAKAKLEPKRHAYMFSSLEAYKK
jgi:hypothetical protein